MNIQPIRGLASVKSKISLTEYNKMVGAVNGMLCDVTSGQGVVSAMSAGNLRFKVIRKQEGGEEGQERRDGQL